MLMTAGSGLPKRRPPGKNPSAFTRTESLVFGCFLPVPFASTTIESPLFERTASLGGSGSGAGGGAGGAWVADGGGVGALAGGSALSGAAGAGCGAGSVSQASAERQRRRAPRKRAFGMAPAVWTTPSPWAIVRRLRTPGRLPRAVVLLGLTSLFTDVASEMIFPLLPAFLVTLGGSAAFLGLIEGLATATASLLKLATGYWSDRFRAKPFVVAGYGIASCVRPLVALATAPWHVLAVRLIDRVGKGIRTTPRDAMLAASVPREQAGWAFGFHHAMDHAGAVIGPLCATLLVTLGFSVRHVFLAAALPSALAVVTVFVVRDPSRAPSGATQPSGAGPEAAAAPREAFPRPLYGYLALVGVFGLGASSDAFLLLRAREAGIDMALLPLVWTVLNLSKLVSASIAGPISHRVPRVRLIGAGWLLYAVCYLAFAALASGVQAWLVFVVYGAYYGLTEPVEKALVRDLAPPSVRGRALGALNFVNGITAVPAGLLTGWLWDRYGSLTALAAGAGLAATAALGLSVWARTASARRALESALP